MIRDLRIFDQLEGTIRIESGHALKVEPNTSSKRKALTLTQHQLMPWLQPNSK